MTKKLPKPVSLQCLDASRPLQLAVVDVLDLGGAGGVTHTVLLQSWNLRLLNIRLMSEALFPAKVTHWRTNGPTAVSAALNPANCSTARRSWSDGHIYADNISPLDGPTVPDSTIMSLLEPETFELALQTPLPTSTSTIFTNSIADDTTDLRNESSLPPVDTGLGAWLFLLAAFFVEVTVWGLPVSFGVFLDAYLQDPRFLNQKAATSLLPLIGTLSSGIGYCSSPFIYPIMNRFPHYRKPFLWIGAVLWCVSLFGASFATNVNELVVLQGVLYAVGGSLVYAPCISYLPEWFVAKRGFANGVIFAGAAAGGLVIPLILPPLFSHFGIPKSLRIVSIAFAVILFPLLPFLKGRLPETRLRVHGPSPRGSRWEWLQSSSFWVLMATNTLQGFAHFIPLIWLPTFASDLNLSPTRASITLSMLNGASVLGQISIGFLSDKFNPWLIALASLVSTSLATFILWGVLSSTFAGLLAFGIVYGVLAGGFSSLWTGLAKPIAKEDHSLTASLFGLLLFSRGLGNIFSTPISSVLSTMRSVAMESEIRTGFAVGGGRFEKMILYAGSCFAGAALIAVLGWIVDVRGQRRTATNSF